MKRRVKVRLAGRSSGLLGVPTPPSATGSGAGNTAIEAMIERRMRPSESLVMQFAARSVAAERFRRLKTTLTQMPESPQVMVVTSGAPGEGKSTVSMNLALAFATSERRSLLIDADLRRPTIDRHLEPRPRAGLTELLRGDANLPDEVVSVAGTGLSVLCAGEPVAEPLELLSLPRMGEIVQEVRETYDHVIVDTPPVLPFTDATQLASLSDGILLVVRSGITPEPALAKALDALVPSRILGVVLNDAGSGLVDGSYYYDRYYRAYYERDRGLDREGP